MPRRSFIVAFLVASAVALAPTSASAAPDRYIVVLKDGVSDARGVAGDHRRRFGARRSSVYRHALKGYAATVPRERLDAIRRDRRVDYIERDGPVHASAQRLPWGVDRVDADRSSTLAGNGRGTVSSVHAYVIDSGIDRHYDLDVVEHVNFGGGPNRDCNGHGTHVAGTLAARDNSLGVVGVAPGAPLTGVKVLDCYGGGTESDVIAGVDYVTRRARDTAGPDVATMSFGGWASRAVDAAVRRSARSGVLHTVAAGNDGQNACHTSPARAGAGSNNGIVTVGATDYWDWEASFSNFGPCVDVWAPGVDILSTTTGGGTTTESGTSFAAPHAAGGAALYRSRHPAVDPSGVERRLKQAAASPVTLSKSGGRIRRLFVGASAGF
jgi:aqualysin 1